MLEALLPVKPSPGTLQSYMRIKSKLNPVQGGIITLAAQVELVLQTGTLMILARLLRPKTLGCRNGRCLLQASRSFRDIGLGAAVVHKRDNA